MVCRARLRFFGVYDCAVERFLTISMNTFAHLHVLLLGLNVLQAFAESDDGLLQGREVL